ncbi:Hypothetical predicted protein [Marmota monax]|uniref:G-protein coupled receptors family 1 profile domain-containing protein n=1 Tax=Marmota monax TaxID=9995 RepID=A0A5E4A704_MARMO|nr:hypothetical protein GHT09_020065 [Marmota monax]VTJ52908.1 Hypothetical predicted protein [Marmota monax]
MYLVTVRGNLLIILATISDSHLHTPMYFFLSNLSFVDICFTSTTIPKMLVNIQTEQGHYLRRLHHPDIVSSIRAISSAQGKYKAFSTCVSHLSVVSLFYGTSLGVYLSSPVTPNSCSTATA